MSIMLNSLRAVAHAIVTSPYVFVLAVLVIVFYRQNRKIVKMQKMIIGEKLNSSFVLTASQVVFGILGGAIGSIMLSYLGVSFNENTSIELVFYISIILALVNPRLICFSYSASILGLISILLEIMREMYGIEVPALSFLNIDIVSLMTLIAVLHFVEGILVMIDGSKCSIPIFTRRDNKIIGGFALKRLWALPIAIVMVVNSSKYPISDVIPINNWNTLLNPSTPFKLIDNAAILLMPFYGVIGYSSITFTKTKKEKSISSGIMIIFYSVILFIFARLAALNIFFRMFVVIFAPAAHEVMLYIQRYIEVIKEPKFVSDDNGMMVLEVAPNSPAYEMGIKSGDLLVEVNNKKILKEDDIIKNIREASNIAWFKIKRAAGNLEEIRYQNINNSKKLGIVFVPVSIPDERVVVKIDEHKFKEVLDKLRGNDK